jgi:hypothetical protein
LEAIEPSLDPDVQQGKAAASSPELDLVASLLAGDDTFHGLTYWSLTTLLYDPFHLASRTFETVKWVEILIKSCQAATTYLCAF